ncbi:hypothetical protein M378DRAFT_93123, partial [Amanita muscaria Koide BX008]
EYVVHVDDNPSFVYHILEVGVHHGLEKHDSWFEKSSWCDERCFPFVSLFNSNIVVTLSKV